MISPVPDAPDAAPAPAATDRPAPDHGAIGDAVGEVRAGLTMLTRLPVGGASGARSGAGAFAVVGAVVGLAGLVPLVALGTAIPPVAAILAIAVMAALTGAIHLDGLADTADALIAAGPDGAERARKDPAVGVGGAVAIVLVLGLDATSLSLVVVDAGPLAAGLACVAAAAVSRAVPVAVGWLSRDHAPADGLGRWFAARVTMAGTVGAASSALLVGGTATLVLGSPVLVTAAVIGLAGGVVLGLGLVKLRGAPDGDLLGATVECSFALTVVVVAAMFGAVV